MDEPLIIGVDPASTKMAVVALYGDEFIIKAVTKLGKSGGNACYNAQRAISSFVEALPWDTESKHAYIESPIVGRGGVRTTMVQCFTSGAIQGTLHGFGFSTEIANVSSWKKRVVGRGNATKDDVREFLRLRWPAIYRGTKGDQDAIDAACIALYGQAITRSRMA